MSTPTAANGERLAAITAATMNAIMIVVHHVRPSGVFFGAGSVIVSTFSFILTVSNQSDKLPLVLVRKTLTNGR
jgi:hypothetical protein